MTPDTPATPPEPRRALWPYTDPEDVTGDTEDLSEPRTSAGQSAFPIPESGAGDSIPYPSDPTRYPSSSEYLAPVSRPAVGGVAPREYTSASPSFPSSPPVSEDLTLSIPPIAVPTQPAPSATPAASAPRRRLPGVLLGLLLGAIIAASAFGLGRLTASDDDPAVATVATSVPSGSLVGTTNPPPAAVVPPGNATLEPVAAAAAAVTPAVVQIDTNSGTGSGVIYDADGYILTAAHVVGNATNVTVRFADGSRTTGRVMGADDVTDVAVVSIEPAEVPAVAVLAVGADLSVGQTAVAVGTPFGLDQTVTSGIISAVDRLLETNGISMVQTDAAINPGNSGGPLVDLSGRVIGINDVIFTNSGDNAGVGFAISIDLAKIVADQLVAGQPVSLARLGVSAGASADGDAGALIQSVSDGTAAAAAGLEVGDLIIAVDGDPVRDSGDLRAEVITRAPGTTVELLVMRGDQQLTITAVLGAVSTN